MSRFGNLEFDTESAAQVQSAAPVRDEAYYLAAAREEFENADFEKALRGYAKALEFNPQNPVAWAGQVRALIELGELREAVLWANKAIERFPRDPQLLAAKAVALARQGELDEALAFSDASIEERGTRRTYGWRGGTCCWPGRRTVPITASTRRWDWRRAIG